MEQKQRTADPNSGKDNKLKIEGNEEALDQAKAGQKTLDKIDELLAKKQQQKPKGHYEKPKGHYAEFCCGRVWVED
jgi:hypothetical protein